MFKQSVREFAEKNIAPRSREIDRKAAGIPDDLLQGMAKLDLFGLTIPEQYGGCAVPGQELVYAMIAVHGDRARRAVNVHPGVLLALPGLGLSCGSARVGRIETRVVAAHCRGKTVPGYCDDRVERQIRPRTHSHDCDEAGWQVHYQRRKDLHRGLHTVGAKSLDK